MPTEKESLDFQVRKSKDGSSDEKKHVTRRFSRIQLLKKAYSEEKVVEIM